jgi:hypothetical protein
MRKWLLVFFMAGMTGITTLADQENDGYFLSLDQKGQLLWLGHIQASDGAWYDIRMAPGYRPPARYGRDGLKESATHFHEYVERKKYSDLKEDSLDAFEWAFEDAFYDFTLKGTGKAWKKYAGLAKQRTKKRIFGWWMSYPWAVMQGTVDTVVRVPVGLTGTALGSVWGAAVAPTYHLTGSTVKGVWNAGAKGVVVPVTGMAWNTVISPPLALLGQKPAEARADGFWVRKVDESLVLKRAPSAEDLANLTQLGTLIQTELAPLEAQRAAIYEQRNQKTKELHEKIRRIQREADTKIKELHETSKTSVTELLDRPENKELAEKIASFGWSAGQISANREAIRRVLAKNGFSHAEQVRIISLLRTHAQIESNPYSKLNPVSESIQVIKEID